MVGTCSINMSRTNRLPRGAGTITIAVGSGSLRMAWSRSGKALQHAPSSKTRRPAIRWSYGLTVVAAIAVACLLGIAKNAFAPDLNNLVFDLYQRIDQAAWTPEAPVRI